MSANKTKKTSGEESRINPHPQACMHVPLRKREEEKREGIHRRQREDVGIKLKGDRKERKRPTTTPRMVSTGRQWNPHGRGAGSERTGKKEEQVEETRTEPPHRQKPEGDPAAGKAPSTLAREKGSIDGGAPTGEK